MRKALGLALIGLLAIGVIGLAGDIGTIDHPIKMVLVPSTQGEAILEVGQQIAEALHNLTGYYIDAILQPDYAAMVETFAASDGDVFGMPTSTQYLSIYNRTNGNVDVRLASLRYGSTIYYGAIYARRDSGIMSILDCNGKKWLATDELSGSGNVIPQAVFDKWGIKPSEKVYTGSHGAAITALVNGEGDFATCYFSPPQPPEGWTGEGWKLGDDLERWLWDPYNNDVYPEEIRGKLKDVRHSIDKIYGVETLIRDFKVVTLIGGAIPNDCVCFGPNFPKEIEDALVEAIKTHIATPEGQALWNDERFYEWTAVHEIDDSFYDGLRAALGMPIPER